MRGVEAGPAVGAARTRSRGDRAATRPTLLGGWLVATIPAVAELAVGGYRIAGPSLWRDEAATISGSQRPVGAIWALTGNQDAVHGAYYLLMHAVIAAGGTSEAVLRMPSLAAMCLAAGLTAALGRRLALASDLPAPDAVGVLAGLLLAAVPLTTRYAQEARPYALTTLFAVLATYLLVRATARTGAAASGGPGAASGAAPGRGVAAWWAGYTAALVLTGLFNLFAVLLAVGHGVSLIAARRAWPAEPQSAAPDVAAPDQGVRVDRGALARWLACCLAAAALLAPIAVLSASQSAQLSWVARPDASTVATLVRDFSGSTWLIPVALVLGWLGCVAGRGVRRGGGMTLAVVSLPWLVLPPALLIAGSLAHPVYVERYVMFCLPALSVLVAAGLVWLVRLTGQALDRRRLAGRRAGRRASRSLATAPAAAIAAVMAVALAGPQVQIRQPGARADNLRAVSAVIARHERPGDAILYLPWDAAVVAMAYPAPFLRLRDIGLGVTPVASATLRGLPASAAVLAGRLRAVARVWTVGWAQPLPLGQATPADVAAARAVAGMRLIGRWRVSSVLLSLYAAR